MYELVRSQNTKLEGLSLLSIIDRGQHNSFYSFKTHQRLQHRLTIHFCIKILETH